jgi:hypothetical protein
MLISLAVFLGELVDRDAGPDRQHLGDRLFVDLVEQVDTVGMTSPLAAFSSTALLWCGGGSASSNCCSSTALLRLLDVVELARSRGGRAGPACA